MRVWIGLVVSLALAFSAAAVGNFVGPGEWYRALDKPPWNPPDWIFGPVWGVLYAMMGVAAWLVWREVGWERGRLALTVYLVQLALNAAWSIIFFGLQSPGGAAIEIALLWVAIVATIVLFWRVKPLAGALLIPYLLWVTFAAALTFEIWRRNPGA